MEITSRAIGAHGVRINASPLAIVELILEKLPTVGTPARVMYECLQASYAANPGNLGYFQCTFNIDPVDLEPHKQKMATLITALKK